MTPEESKRIEETLDILELGFISAEMKAVKKEVIPELESDVERIFQEGKFDVAAFELPGVKYYKQLFKRFLWENWSQGYKLAWDELKAKEIAVKVSSKVTLDPVIPERAVNLIDKWTDYFGDNYYGDATADVAKVLKNSLEQGMTNKETMNALSMYLSGPSFNQGRLETIARTNATTFFNQGRLEQFKQNQDFVPAVEYNAILDTRTTQICRDRDGKIMRLNDPKLEANTPPLHYKCRSILSPVVAPEWEEMQEPGWKDPIDGKTLMEKMDWKTGENGRKIAPPAKGFGEGLNFNKSLKKQAENDIIKDTGFDLQLFGAKDPKEQVEEYVTRLENWKEGDDKRLRHYTRENVDKAVFYFKKYLKSGIKAPDGMFVNITEKDFYKQITVPGVLLKPQLIKEIITNAIIKVKQKNGRYMYISKSPAGYAVVGKITYSVHLFGRGEKGIKNAIKERDKIISLGGEVLWERN